MQCCSFWFECLRAIILRKNPAVSNLKDDHGNSNKHPEATQQLLAERAAERGQTVESYAAELIQRSIAGSRSFAEILAPFRDEVAKSNMPDRELDELFEAARNEAFAAKQAENN